MENAYKLNKTEKVGLWSIFWEFCKVGLFTIGGGLVMIPVISRVAVDEKKWITDEEMLDCIALSQAVPGMIALNVATFVGYKKRGVAGGVIASVGVVLPSFLIILALAKTLTGIGDNKYVQGAFKGVKGAVAGLIVCTSYFLAQKNLKNVFQWTVAIAAFIVVAVFKANAIITVLTAGAIGVIYSLLVEKKIISKFGDKSLELPQGRKKSKEKTHCNSDVKAKGDDSDDE